MFLLYESWGKKILPPFLFILGANFVLLVQLKLAIEEESFLSDKYGRGLSMFSQDIGQRKWQ